MAGLFVARGTGPDRGEAALASARAAFSRQGFVAPTELAVPGWRALHWPHVVGGPATLHRHGPDLAAVAGTPTVDGRTGAPALAALLEAVGERGPDWSRVGGHFAALVRARGRTWLFCDHLAAFQLFRDEGRTLFSTALLAAVESLPRVCFDPQGVYEFAFNVTALGDDTVFREVKLVGPNVLVELTEDGAREHATPKPLPDAPDALPLPDRVARARAALERVVGAQVGSGAPVHCPLSGGLDSRLLLAALRRAGAAPAVYVYGPPGSPDVAVARAIGKMQGFPVAWTDKQAAPIAPDAFPAAVERNFHENDALPNFGNIFDNGGNLAARDARHAGGWTAASGGGGEVYRDFFFLPDRRLTALDVARTFFARFTAADAAAGFDPRAFVDRIAAKMLDALERPGDRGPLPRTVVEQLYPRFRCRALFGREISLESRRGPYFVPFLDRDVVADALLLPMRLRAAGRFEAALLVALDPDLAALPSAYGHHFAGPPSARHRFSEWRTRVRPIWVRQGSYALRRRLGRQADEHGGLLGAEYLGRVIDPEFPAMRRFFAVDRIGDHGLLRRVACLEYLAGYLGSRLVG